MLGEIDWPDQPRLRVAFADSACHRDELYDHVASKWYRLRIVNRPADAVGFVVLSMRREVERTFGWIVQSRRDAKDYERTLDSSEAQIYIASTRRLLRRLTDKVRYSNSGQGKAPQNQRNAA